jgi:DNA polymerase III epsilon subunit-like protein
MQLGPSLMIDIETLGTNPGCVVLSIGACEFSDKGVGKQFYTSINPESCTQWGLTIEPRTVLWWFDQSQDARDFITKGKHVDLDIALAELKAAFKWKGKNVWCNGANFDFPILTAAHNAIGQPVPWEYWAGNDYRTIKNLVGRDVFDACKVAPTVAHNALADAVAQAETLINMAKYIQIDLPSKEKKRAAA